MLGFKSRYRQVSDHASRVREHISDIKRVSECYSSLSGEDLVIRWRCLDVIQSLTDIETRLLAEVGREALKG